ncbi:hypothetical protein B0T17DRAFT_621192 [Bombardia bombarda]|uniref:Uncharacterized protein n=1 Tax=Bombardia bombarda TaxID=252184 RepID=A0AA39U0M3_9PEZI|nr:hypothetical protein B0T17DRAFT_621192 [Bombardia bombarda]
MAGNSTTLHESPLDALQNITTLAQLKIADLTDLIVTHGGDNVGKGTPCTAASGILPLTDLALLGIKPTTQGTDEKNSTLSVTADPAALNVGLLDLQAFAGEMFPFPLNGSSVGDVAAWWTNTTTSDKQGTMDFLGAVVNNCATTYCRSGYITIGNPDIVGIGVSSTNRHPPLPLRLLLPALPRAHHPHHLSRRRRPRSSRSPAKPEKQRFSFRHACIGTVDELFSAVFIFGIAVLVSTSVFRQSTDARFDVLMADGLSLFCSTSILMLAATYWSHNRQRPHATVSVIISSVLTVALFGTHFHVVNKHANPAELACGTGKGWVNVSDGDPFDMRLFRFVPVGFACWCLALVGAGFHHPWVSLPSVFGSVSLVIYAVYFFNTWQMMKGTYGKAFTKSLQTWGFGQYLAVFTWLPPIMTFVHLFFAGMKGVLETRLPSGWKVYREEDEDEDPDMDGVDSSPVERRRRRRMMMMMMMRRRSRSQQWESTSFLSSKTGTQLTVYPASTFPFTSSVRTQVGG